MKINIEEDQLLALIHRAFATVPVPAKDSITHCTCAECMEIREDFAGKPAEELEAERMRFHSWDMGFFTAQARQYYLPGWMRLGITQPHSSYPDAVLQTLGSRAGWDPPGGYTDIQREAIFEFLKWIKNRGEHDGDLDFEIAWDEWSTESPSDLPHEGSA